MTRTLLGIVALVVLLAPSPAQAECSSYGQARAANHGQYLAYHLEGGRHCWFASTRGHHQSTHQRQRQHRYRPEPIETRPVPADAAGTTQPTVTEETAPNLPPVQEDRQKITTSMMLANAAFSIPAVVTPVTPEVLAQVSAAVGTPQPQPALPQPPPVKPTSPMFGMVALFSIPIAAALLALWFVGRRTKPVMWGS